jgi:Tfp pilus assembly protein PilF
MSLLLEALKKAEKAKEEAQRQARGEAEGANDAAPATSDPAAPPVRTRDQLPDINQPLEILSEPPPPARAAPLALQEEKREEKRAREPQAPSRAQSAPRAQAAASDAQATDRAAARKVFEAKFREPNPRLPFYITMAALGVFTVGTGVYFWMQLRPPPSLVNANPPRQAAEARVTAAQAPTAPAASAPTPTAQSALLGLPGSAPLQQAAQAPVAPAKPAAPAPRALAETPRVEVPRLQPQPRRVEPRAEPETEVRSNRAAPQVHPKVGAGYTAYVAGDLGAARTNYQDALREEPSNRDALLGLAALDVRAGRHEAAEAAYLRLLQIDPRDAHAQAALMQLRGGRVDPAAASSRVKLMLAENPGAHALNFTLGNQFAQQGRWAEAQQEYFKAFGGEPDNADYAYNLAVSLDHLRQPKLALNYYQRAVALAKARGAGFDVAAAEARAAQLAR